MTSRYNSTFELLKHVDGWLTSREAEFLRNAARYGGGNVIDVGTYRGLSALMLATGLADYDLGTTFRVFTFDPHHHHTGINGQDFGPEDGEVAQRNFDRFFVGRYVVPTQAAFTTWSHRLPLAATIFIDGDHNTPAVVEDIRHATDIIYPGGVIACHDYNLPSVAAAIDVLNPANTAVIDSIIYWRKPMV